MTNYEYEEARNELIPHAVKYADENTKGIRGESKKDWGNRKR